MRWGFSPAFQPRLKIDELQKESLAIFSGNKAQELVQALISTLLGPVLFVLYYRRRCRRPGLVRIL